MSTIIFNELDRNQTAVYDVKGCEKTVVVRSSGVFNLVIEAISLKDPHKRPLPVATITQDTDFCLHDLCLACGMQLIFRTDATMDPQAHLFVEILDYTCVPEPCCNCA